MDPLIELLEHARNQSLQFAQTLSDEALAAKQNEDGWTVGQILEHIAMVQQATTVNIAKGLASQADFEERDIDLKPIVLDRSRKIAAPEAIHPGAQKSREELLALLNRSHDGLMSVLSPFVDQLESLRKVTTAREHPVLGKLSVYQFSEAAGLHELRHIEQIKEILASTGETA